MNGPVRFHQLARRELNATARYYESESPGLGIKFVDVVERCARGIVELSNAGTELGGNFSRRLVNGFPSEVLYRKRSDQIRVLAIMNLKRRPKYWAGRE